MAKWLIDAGHGGNDPGAVYKGRKEAEDVLKLAKSVCYILTENGENAILTRDVDKTLELNERTSIENKGSYDYFISIHRNAFEPEKAKGVETYSLSITGKGRELAEKVQAELTPYFTDRKCKTANFYVLKKTNCPSILIEVGFVDNTEDNKSFDNNFENIAKGISKACLKQVGKTIEYIQKPISVDSDGFYRVIAGSYKDKQNAINMQNLLIEKGIPSFLEFKK